MIENDVDRIYVVFNRSISMQSFDFGYGQMSQNDDLGPQCFVDIITARC